MSGLRPVRASMLLLALGWSAGIVIALEEAPASRPRTVSPWISEAVRARLPRYAPVKEEAATVEISGVAEVKDDVLHLPTMTVRQAGEVSPEIVNWLTAAGRTELALKRYPGTKIGNILGLNTPWALARLQEDIEAGRKDSLKARGQAVLIEDTPHDRETARLLKAALIPINRD